MMSKYKPILGWAGILILSLFVLSGRYDWENSFETSKVSYVCSAFFLLISLPVSYYLFLHYMNNGRLAFGVSMVFALLLILPYHWLGLEKYSVNNTFQLPPATGSPVFDWFPAALNQSAIPHERKLFFFLFFLGFSIAVFLWRQKTVPNKLIAFGLFFYVMILIQTWLHLSLRSPYTYAGSLSGPNSWRVFFLFPDGKGAVNNDYPVHRFIEGLFMGMPAHLLLIRRSFYYYLTSQLSYFFHPYYVSLLLNIALWFCAVLCGYAFVKRIWGEQIGLITAVLIACGTGFIYFVAQPMSYLAGYALCIILIYLFQHLIIDEQHTIGVSILFGAILGLSLLVYEILAPIFIFILGYGILRRVRWYSLLTIISMSLSIYLGYTFLLTHGLGQSLEPYPFHIPEPHILERINLILTGNLNQIYLLSTQLVVRFFGGLGNAFFVVPLVLSVIGLTCVHGYARKVIVLILLTLPLFWSATFHFGDITYRDWLSYSTLPRYSYIGYPVVYILAALALKRVEAGLVRINQFTFPVGKALFFLILIGIFVLNNVDVWGFQSLYYLFYFLSPSLTY